MLTLKQDLKDFVNFYESAILMIDGNLEYQQAQKKQEFSNGLNLQGDKDQKD